MRGPSVLADLVIGPHSPLTEWVFEVVAHLAADFPERRVVRTDRFDTIDFLAEQRPICLANYPSKALLDAIDAGDARVFLAIEDPIDVALYLGRALNLPMMEAIRAQTATAVANLAIGRAQGVRYLSRTTEATVGQIIEGLAAHLGLPVSDAAMARVVMTASIGLGAGAPLESVLAQRGRHYAPRARDRSGFAIAPEAMVAAEVIEPLLAMARGDTTRPIVWPTPVFTFRDDPLAPTPRTVEVSGPVRDLYYGPYLYLPPARYRVEAILAFSDEIKDVPFVLEVHGATWLARARIDQRGAGDYRGYFMLDHREPTATVEIRLRNERGVMAGRLSLIELLFFYNP